MRHLYGADFGATGAGRVSVRPPAVLTPRMMVSWWGVRKGARSHAFRILAAGRDSRALCGLEPNRYRFVDPGSLPECARCAELLEPL